MDGSTGDTKLAEHPEHGKLSAIYIVTGEKKHGKQLELDIWCQFVMKHE